MSFAEHECCLLGFGKGDVTMISALMQAAVVQMCTSALVVAVEHRGAQRPIPGGLILTQLLREIARFCPTFWRLLSGILPMYEQMEQRSPRKFAICASTVLGFWNALT